MRITLRFTESDPTRTSSGFRVRCISGLVASVLLSGTLEGPARADRVVEYWTIEANEGLSAGGHAAIRIDDTVYHVEHRGDGLIIDRRDDRHDFERTYRLMGNRSIGALSLDLPPAVEEELETILRRRYFERQQRTDRLAELEEDLRWLDLAIAKGGFEVEVPGAGLFDPEAGGCALPEARRRAERKARIVRNRGAGWLEGRLVIARRRLHEALGRVVAGSSGSDGGLRRADGVAGRGMNREREAPDRDATRGGGLRDVVEAAQALEALEVVIACRGPTEGRLLTVPPGALPAGGIDGGDPTFGSDGPTTGTPRPSREPWQTIAEALEGNLSRLLASGRPDAGLAILLTWARLAALDRTLVTGVPTLLDPFAEPGSGGVSRPIPGPLVPGQVAVARRILKGRLERLASEDGIPLEARLFGIERARHALVHAEAGELHAGAPRASPFRVTRANRYAAAILPLPWPGDARLRDLERRRDELAKAARRLRHRLDAELGYGLIDRNCVTELLTALDEALEADPGTASFARDRRRDAAFTLSFIPVVAGRVVRRHLPVASVREMPGWREERLARLRDEVGDSLALRFRESNTLSTRTYWGAPDDSIFLFFSREPAWSRPIVGIPNLAVGMGAAVVGVLRAPFDRGWMLRRGLQGVLMSLPELFFFNIRKGSFVVVPDSTRSDGAASAFEAGGT
ncbi:MAG TPA: hypothetical protein ENI85_18545 [Deltaproteobacteria bacterium]|nr:hypothetical protein [Deltaproteobacteria bacterium]